MKIKTFNNLLNVGGLIVTLFMIAISWVFSDVFFHLATGWEWVGYVVITAITVLEWVYIRDGKGLDPWIIRAALTAYIYDVISNIGGFLVGFNVPIWDYVLHQQWNLALIHLPAVLIAIGLGFFLAILPERMLRHFVTKVDFGAIAGSLGGTLHKFFNPVLNHEGRKDEDEEDKPKRNLRGSRPLRPLKGVNSKDDPLRDFRNSMGGGMKDAAAQNYS